MNRALWFLALLAILTLGVAVGCDCDDDDDDDDNDDNDDDNNDSVDDDTADDDSADDDSGDDDSGDDDTTTIPYDTAECAPFVEAFYDDCQFTLQIDETELDAAEAQASCETYEYLFWPCAVECFLDFGNGCVELYDCIMECNAE